MFNLHFKKYEFIFNNREKILLGIFRKKSLKLF